MGIYEGMKPSSLCCSSCEEIHRLLAVPQGSVRLDDAYKRTRLFCRAEEAFLAGGKQPRPAWAAGAAAVNALLHQLVCCEVRGRNTTVISTGKAQRMSTG